MKYHPKVDDLFALFPGGARREINARRSRRPASVSVSVRVNERETSGGLNLPWDHARLDKLDAAGVIAGERNGRTRICRPQPDAIAAARGLLDGQA